MIMRKRRFRLDREMRRFRRDDRGAAMIEFALVLPIMIVLLLGLVEFGEAFSVTRKINYAAAAAADLVSQSQSVDKGDLDDIIFAAKELLKPYRTDKFGIVITSVVADDKDETKTTVAWSYASGAEATALTKGESVPLHKGLTEAGSSIILAETTYQFTPTVGYYLLGTRGLTASAFFRPRYTQSIPKTD